MESIGRDKNLQSEILKNILMRMGYMFGEKKVKRRIQVPAIFKV